MKSYIWPIFCMIPIMPTHAYLQASTYQEPGMYCDSECTSSEEGCGILRKIECNDDCSDLNAISAITEREVCSNYTDNKYCYVGAKDNSYYFCEPDGESTCSIFGYYATTYSSWSIPLANHSVIRTKYSTYNSGDYICKIGITGIEYGCVAKYYATANAGNVNISCTPCPNNGLSEPGTTSKTSCYLKSGTYSDSSGTFQISGNCYYNE